MSLLCDKGSTRVERDESKPFGFGGECDVCRSSSVERVPFLGLLKALAGWLLLV